jgi:hypothetical protein
VQASVPQAERFQPGSAVRNVARHEAADAQARDRRAAPTSSCGRRRRSTSTSTRRRRRSGRSRPGRRDRRAARDGRAAFGARPADERRGADRAAPRDRRVVRQAAPRAVLRVRPARLRLARRADRPGRRGRAVRSGRHCDGVPRRRAHVLDADLLRNHRLETSCSASARRAPRCS